MATCDFWAPVTKVLALFFRSGTLNGVKTGGVERRHHAMQITAPWQVRANGRPLLGRSPKIHHPQRIAVERRRSVNRRFPSGYRIVTTNPCLRNRRDHLGSSRMAIWPDSPAGDVALKRRSSSVAQHSRSAKPVARVLSAPIRHRRTPIPAITAVMTPRRSSSAQANSAMPPILQDLHNSVVIRSSSAMRRT